MKLAAPVMLAVMACCGGKATPAPSNLPTVEQILTRLAADRAARTSFSAESVMDYWFGDQRVKGGVLVMGTTGAKVRFNALSPAGGSVLADMACDGTNFSYVDYQNNCQLMGPCNRSSIATLLHVELDPQDFLHLAVGAPPVLDQATGKVSWDANKGAEHVELTAPAGTQTIDLDIRDGRMDVVSSELKRSDGTVVWSVENRDWETVNDEAGKSYRVPSKTRFKSPKDKSDLLVEWKERKLNVVLDGPRFQVAIPEGLPICGQKPKP